MLQVLNLRGKSNFEHEVFLFNPEYALKKNA